MFGWTVEEILKLLESHPLWVAHEILSSGDYTAETMVNEWFPDGPEKQKLFKALKDARQQRRDWKARSAL